MLQVPTRSLPPGLGATGMDLVVADASALGGTQMTPSPEITFHSLLYFMKKEKKMCGQKDLSNRRESPETDPNTCGNLYIKRLKIKKKKMGHL